MPRVFHRRPFPAFSRSPDFPTQGLGIEWPPIAASPEPDVVHEVIVNVVEVPGPPIVTGGTSYRPTSQVLSSFAPEALGIRAISATSFSTAALTTNQAYYIPFTLWEAITVVKLFVNNGATISGNIDVGIYDSAGSRKVSSGSTAHAGASAMQAFDVTDTLLTSGRYYLAIAMDNATATIQGQTNGIQDLRALGVMTQATAFPLPAAATFATLAQARAPMVGLSQRTALE